MPTTLLDARPWIACRDVLEAVEFFTERLGFAREWVWGDPVSDAGVVRDDVALYLFKNEELAGRVAGSEISIFVDDVDALYREHVERGAPIARPIRDEPWGTREYHVTAVSGYVLRFGASTHGHS